jgi:hypothetical protein
MSRQSNEPKWPVSWEAARNALIDSALEATPTQRLSWLESALRLAFDAGALPAMPEEWVSPPVEGATSPDSPPSGG